MNMPLSHQPDALQEADASSSAAPLQQSQRIAVIDSLRGFALLGILLMNIPYFADSYYAAYNLNIKNEWSGANYYSWWIVNGFFEGTMRALFSMLFGAGSILLLSRLEKKKMNMTPADFFYRRLIWLLVFGVINAFIFLWAGDILYAYALCGLFLYPLRNLKPKHLLLLGFTIMLISNLRMTIDLYRAKNTRVKGEHALALQQQKIRLSETQEAALEKWKTYQEKHTVTYIRKQMEEERAEYKKGYFSLMGFMKDINVKIQSAVMYDEYFWDVLSFLLIGMALFKWGVFTGERSAGFYWMLFLIGYGAGFALSYWWLTSITEVRFDQTQIAEKVGFNFYQERRLLQSMGHVGLLLLMYKYRVFTFLLNWLAKVGQMAFSNYLMQSILCAIIFYGFGFALFGQLQRYQFYYVVGAIWIFQIIFSHLWLRWFRFGPFEWLWRSLTYWKRQPLKR